MCSRPATLDDVSSQTEVVAALKSFINSRNLPHLLLYGPAGTGKTSTVLALAKDLFGPEFYRHRILELNASDERGIQVVREKIKNFAKLVANETAPNYPSPPYKLVVLDEADSMTSDAQSALRRIIEAYSNVTRFCIICNYVTKIIDPISSRCAKFRFKPLEKSQVVDRLRMITTAENAKFSEESLERLYDVSEGDLRRAIMLLQGASKLTKGLSADADVIDDVSGVIPDPIIAQFWDLCLHESCVDLLYKFARDKIILNAYSVGQFVLQSVSSMMNISELSNDQKAEIAQKLSLADFRLSVGAGESLQLLDLVGQIWRICNTQSPQ